MKVEIELKNFTPLLDALVQKYGVIAAAIYGIVWRYAQMDNRVCNASLEKIGKRLDVSGKTAERHIKRLCADGYLTDLTPSVRNKPHSYAITGKAELSGSIVASPDRKSDQGQTESLTGSDRESDQGQTESPLKIHTKKQTKKDKASSANADFSHPVSLLSEKEVKALELAIAGWKQYLEDEQAERGRTGVIKFIEGKIQYWNLLPHSDDEKLLFEILKAEYEDAGKSAPKKFPARETKRLFNEAAGYHNGALESVIKKAIHKRGKGISKIIDYISSPKWRDNNENQNRTNADRSPRSNETNANNFAPPPGSGQTPEMARKLREAFAPKP